MNGTPVILHVEDDHNDVLLVELAFKKATSSAVLQVVHDGEQAVEYLSGVGRYRDRQAFPMPAVVLLDIKLPRRSGMEVLSWVRSRDELRRMPVIMLTSSNQPSDVNRAYDLGVNSYLVKPSALDDLVETIRKLSAYWLEMNLKPVISDEEL
jgi:CheY-like chemotaxis protein